MPRAAAKAHQDVRPTGIALHGHLENMQDLKKADDRVENSGRSPSGHAEDRTVRVDLLPPSELSLESDAASHKATDSSLSRSPLPESSSLICRSRPSTVGLPYPIETNDPNNFSRLQPRTNVLQCPVDSRVPVPSDPFSCAERLQRKVTFDDRLAQYLGPPVRRTPIE